MPRERERSRLPSSRAAGSRLPGGSRRRPRTIPGGMYVGRGQDGRVQGRQRQELCYGTQEPSAGLVAGAGGGAMRVPLAAPGCLSPSAAAIAASPASLPSPQFCAEGRGEVRSNYHITLLLL